MISFPICGGRFTPRLFPTFVTLVVFIILIQLGSWQVARLHWKLDLVNKIETRTHLPPVAVESLKRDADVEYRPAMARGEFLNNKEFNLVVISKTGEGGYDILTPMKLANGDYILINRGFVPYDKKPSAKRIEGQIKGLTAVTGLLRMPPKTGWITPANRPADNMWYSIDLPGMARQTGVPSFLPFTLDADATPNPGGYPVGGQTRLELPNSHLGYAITWYGLALGLIGVYGISQWKREAAQD